MINLDEFKEHIAAVCGLRFDERNGEEKLARALRMRMAATGFDNAPAYRQHLISDQAEFQALVELLTINETYFFREPEQISLLTDHIVPGFLARNNGGKTRILSAGCSSGEEPYSLAMALWERYGASVPHFFTITGVDIDNTALAKAQRGIYLEFSFRGLAPQLHERYFDRVAEGWQVKDDIRAHIDFYPLNLLAAQMATADIGTYDIIFFRNVSIYFDEPTRRQIQTNLAALMKDDSVLVVGVTETIANDLGVLSMVEENGLYYFVKGTPPVTKKNMSTGTHSGKTAVITDDENSTPAAGGTPSTQAPLPVLATPKTWKIHSVGSTIEEPARLVQAEEYTKALPLLEVLLQHDADNPKALLLKAHILMNRKQFAPARTAATRVLEQDNWNVDALVLLGLIAKWDEQPDEALGYFKQALYACHTCWPARYYLADIYRSCGAIDQAQREYRITLQQVNIAPDATGIDIIPIDLPLVQMQRLCRHQLAKLASVTSE